MHRRLLPVMLAALALSGCLTGQQPTPVTPNLGGALHALDPQDGTDAPGSAPHPFHGLAPRAYVATSKGTFVIELAQEEAPRLVDAFLNLTAHSFYDGTRFHRLVRDSFIQGGDPNSRTEDRSGWGFGGPGYALPDEFNAALRHDAPGTVSMATPGIDAVGSQFFVTLGPAPSLDDRFPVIGYVVAGMDVVRAIGAGAIVGGGADGQPVDPVTIAHITVVPPDTSGQVRRGVDAAAALPSRVVPPGLNSTAVVVVRNTGNARDTVQLTAAALPGWQVRFDPPSVALPARGSWAVLVTVVPPVGATQGDVRILARSLAEPAALAAANLTFRVQALGPPPRAGERSRADYAGFLADGRLFDTDVASVASDPALPHMSSVFRARSSYAPYDFTPGSGVVDAFTWLAERTPIGASEAGSFPASMGYTQGDRGNNPLLQRGLVFDLRLLSAG
jgi:peptidyl-prolyl cis-trans isomerase A (cyclophilin A)